MTVATVPQTTVRVVANAQPAAKATQVVVRVVASVAEAAASSQPRPVVIVCM